MLKIKRQPWYLKLAKFLARNGSFLGFLLAMALVGFVIQYQWIGYVVLLLYAAGALIRQFPYQVTFLLALAALAVVPVAIVLSGWVVAENFAAYGFALLAMGMFMITAEERREFAIGKQRAQ